MTPDRTVDTITLRREHANQIVSLLREFGRFLDDCDEQVADVLDDYFGFGPGAESFSAALDLAADELNAALAHAGPLDQHHEN